MLHDENEIRKDDIVIYYTHYPNQFISHPKLGKRIVSLLHFYGIKEDCLKISDIQPDVLFTAADLRKYSKLYKKNLDDLACNYLLLPFVYEERFRITVPFKERKNKAMAIGTVTYFKNEEFKKMYSTYCYQPLRKQIYDNKERLSRYIDCYIMPYKEDREKEVKTGDNIFLRSYYWIVNHFNNSQRKYFSFDMVDKFNEYKIAICPEDAQGMPGIGFVEAMASGCAFLGLKYGAYEDLGLIEGVHYIAYDGSITDLRAKIEYYTSQEHQKELSNIAQNGYEYVKNNFNKEIVAKRFVDYFERLLDVNER